MTTKELTQQWLEDYAPGRIKQRTLERYISAAQSHIIPAALGEMDITAVRRSDIQNFLLTQKRTGNCIRGGELSVSSINILLTVLVDAFAYACDMEYLQESPCEKVRRLPVKGKKVEAFTRDEQKRIELLLDEQADSRAFGIRLCLYTGLRIGELLALRWEDIDFTTGIMRVDKSYYRSSQAHGYVTDTVKSASSNRLIPLPRHILRLAKRSRQAHKSPFVVCTHDGRQISVHSYQMYFARLTVRAGVRTLNFHALRHTFATRALECGVDIRSLSDIMGHSDASLTINRYAHSIMETKIVMMNKLSGIF